MFQFTLTNAPATLENFNPHTEQNGPEKVPATDLTIKVVCSAEQLKYFEASLDSMLFDMTAPRDLADGMPLRDPHMVYPLHRDEEMTGAVAKIGWGVGDPMQFGEAKLNKFKLEPMAGGSVIIIFHLHIKPDMTQAGQLYMLQARVIDLSIVPPELPTLPSKEGDSK